LLTKIKRIKVIVRLTEVTTFDFQINKKKKKKKKGVRGPFWNLALRTAPPTTPTSLAIGRAKFSSP
jgi:hypothetical protein